MSDNWKLSHIAMAVKDLDSVKEFFTKTGIGVIGEEVLMENPAGYSARMCFIKVGNTEIEFFQPVKGKSMISDFIDQYGEGMHHLSFEVDDIDGEVATLTSKELPLIMFQPTSRGKMAFLDTSAVAGMVLELEG